MTDSIDELRVELNALPPGFLIAARMVVDLARRRHPDDPERVTPVDVAAIAYLLEDDFVSLTDSTPEALFGLFGFRFVGCGPNGKARYGSVIADPGLLRDELTERWLVPKGEEHLLQAWETLRIRRLVARLTHAPSASTFPSPL